MECVYQLKIALKGTKPQVWRTVLVDPDITFYELHHIIQISMGWWNSHLYEFNVFGYPVGGPEWDDTENLIDAKDLILSDIINEEGESFNYLYDFGDNWHHLVTLEKMMLPDPALQYPHCIKGRRNCPPEDCGGIHGFEQILEALSRKSHPAFRATQEWIGPGYQPDRFDIERINCQLAVLDEYIREWEDVSRED